MRRGRGICLAVLLFLLAPFPSPAETRQGRFLTGKLLVAAESIGDPRFRHSVIFMVRHDETGAMGLIINKKRAEMKIKDLVGHFGIEAKADNAKLPVFYGGPVMPQLGFLLHSPDYKGASTVAAHKSIHMSADKELLAAIAAGEGPKNILFSFGYSGWAPGQLEGEIARGDWYNVPADADMVFRQDQDQDSKWEKALSSRGVDL